MILAAGLPAASFLSGARLGGVRFTLPSDRERLDRGLRRWGSFALQQTPDYPAGQHPICCELWRLTDGRVEIAGVDQHEWYARFAASSSAMLGLLSRGRAARWLSDASSSQAQLLGQLASRVFGTYHELILTIPKVMIQGRRDGAHTLVMGMVTDSSLARWADKAFGFGFSKQAGRFEATGSTSWCVSSHGRRLLEVRLDAQQQRLPAGCAHEVNALWRDPLLGGMGGSQLVGSHFRRDLLAPGVSVASVTGSVELARDLSLGTVAGTYALEPGAVGRWSPLAFRNVHARISYPWLIREVERRGRAAVDGE